MPSKPLQQTWFPPSLLAAEAFQKYMEWTQSHLDSGHSTAISFYAKLADWVTPITKDNANDGAAQKAIDDLLAFNVPEFSVRNYLPKYLAKIDPEGLVVPQALAKRIKELKNPDLGGHHALGFDGGRTGREFTCVAGGCR